MYIYNNNNDMNLLLKISWKLMDSFLINTLKLTSNVTVNLSENIFRTDVLIFAKNELQA